MTKCGDIFKSRIGPTTGFYTLERGWFKIQHVKPGIELIRFLESIRDRGQEYLKFEVLSGPWKDKYVYQTACWWVHVGPGGTPGWWKQLSN